MRFRLREEERNEQEEKRDAIFPRREGCQILGHGGGLENRWLPAQARSYSGPKKKGERSVSAPAIVGQEEDGRCHRRNEEKKKRGRRGVSLEKRVRGGEEGGEMSLREDSTARVGMMSL